MALVKAYAVSCDTCLVQAGPLMVDSVDARAYAKRHGWIRIPRSGGPYGRGADYCPIHNPARSA